MLENVRKRRRTFPKRQRFANLESEDLNSLLDTAQAQTESIIQHTLLL